MEKLKLAAIIALNVSLLTSCININPFDEPHPGNQIEEIFNVNNFTEVEVCSSFEVVIIPGNEFKLTANGDERDIEDLNVRVINKKLKVNYVSRNFLSNIRSRRVDILIETPDLEGIEISGAANVAIEDFSYFPGLTVEISGASKLNLDVKLGELDVELKGASTFTITKETPFITADLSGASKLNAYKANSEKAYLELSGASRANVAVSEYLQVNASGASTVSYEGSPRIDQDLSGASKVKKN
ncbi:MAG: hypothetical protein ACI8UX_000687 [Psychromonas sp.]|jgi:hypothetical protein